MKLITPLEEFNLLKGKDFATLECSVCSKHFQRIKKTVLDQKRSNKYCSVGCSRKAKSRVEVPCNSCGVLVSRIPSHFTKYKYAYCSRSCAARENNLMHPKRKPEGTCKTCDSPCMKRNTYCKSCWDSKVSDYSSMIIGDYRNLLSVKGKHVSWRNVRVRQFARSWNKDLTSSPCQKCSYSLHVELAHIKPVSSFPDTATLWEANAPENLLVLCRNCHWEFDNGLFTIIDIPSR